MSKAVCKTEQMAIQRRAYNRVDVNIPVKFYCYNTDYTGTIQNISENGMFITTKEMSFPFDSYIDLIIPFRERLLKVPVKVIRITKSENTFNGLGVQVVQSDNDYLNLVSCFKGAV